MMSKNKNEVLRTSVWRDTDNNITMEVVYVDVVAKSKWSVAVALTPEQADSLAMRLTVARKGAA
jgi:hypothetical protein